MEKRKFATYELENNLLEKGCGKYIVGVDEVGRGCERIDAEILTDSGWKFYDDLSLSDKVLSYTNVNTIEWQPINDIIIKEYHGNLIELKNRSIDICVTPDHYFDVLRRTFKRDSEYKLRMTGFTFRGRKNVNDLNNNDFIPRGGKWLGNNDDYFVLPSIDKLKNDTSGKSYNSKYIPMKLWIAFIGIYLAEGHCVYDELEGAYLTVITQIKNDTRKVIKSLLEKLPFEFSSDKKRFVIYNKQLSNYMRRFGDCYTKFIPKYLKELSPELLNILIDWMVLGDGSCYKGKNRKKVCVYYTTSKKLRDDFEEVVIKAGWSYKTNVREPKDSCIRDRLILKENCTSCYEIRLRRNISATVKFFHKSLIKYKGKVFCLSLPEHHNFYVRRSGSGYFTGNCGAGAVTAGAVWIPESKLPKLLVKVRDSKALTEKRRSELYELIDETCVWAIASVDNETIDAINILEATKMAMKMALGRIMETIPIDHALIDGTVVLKDFWSDQTQVIRGDQKSISIAAASIMAKVTRDEEMKMLHWIYPQYGWLNNKGYLTKQHCEAIKTYGITNYHRKSFRKVGDYES